MTIASAAAASRGVSGVPATWPHDIEPETSRPISVRLPAGVDVAEGLVEGVVEGVLERREPAPSSGSPSGRGRGHTSPRRAGSPAGAAATCGCARRPPAARGPPWSPPSRGVSRPTAVILARLRTIAIERHALQQRLPDRRVVQVLRRDALARQAVLADQPDDGRAVGRPGLVHRGEQARQRGAATSGYDATASPRLTVARPERLGPADDPAVDRLPGGIGRGRVRQPQQVAVRPAVRAAGTWRPGRPGRSGPCPRTRRRRPCAAPGPSRGGPARPRRRRTGACPCGRPSAAPRRRPPCGPCPRRSPARGRPARSSAPGPSR